MRPERDTDLRIAKSKTKNRSHAEVYARDSAKAMQLWLTPFGNGLNGLLYRGLSDLPANAGKGLSTERNADYLSR